MYVYWGAEKQLKPKLGTGLVLLLHPSDFSWETHTKIESEGKKEKNLKPRKVMRTCKFLEQRFYNDCVQHQETFSSGDVRVTCLL